MKFVLGMEKGMVRFLVLTAIFFVAGSGILYELIIATVSSYFLGGTIEHFSITIGFFMLGLGAGAYLSGKIKKKLLQRFIQIEMLLTFLGGMAATICYLTYTYIADNGLVMIPFIFGIGTLVGMELPLLIRLMKRDEVLADALAFSFTADYIGALVASLAFPFLLLPLLGPIATSFFAGFCNALAIFAIVYAYKVKLPFRYLLFLILLGASFLILLFQKGTIEMTLERLYFQHRILYLHHSPYQRIIVSSYGDQEYHLYLDHRLQFSSLDEYRYHEFLVHPAMMIGPILEGRVLFIGAGDGLAAREVLKYDSLLKEMIIVDIDSTITHLARTFPPFRKLNQNALDHSHVKVIHEDGYTFLEKDTTLYDVIIVDLPDPEVPEVERLYSQEFYRLVQMHLPRHGRVVVQGSSPYHDRKAYWCIVRTIRSVFPHVLPYWTIVPRFGIWGFVMASPDSLSLTNIYRLLKSGMIPLQYLDSTVFAAGLHFPEDMDSVPVPVNTLFHPVLHQFY